MKLPLLSALCALTLAMAGACSSHHNGLGNEDDDKNVPTTFAKGADVSWLTELESKDIRFYDKNGKEKECMSLLRDECGVNSIRLRVWVNPEDGWNNAADVLVKAKRANELGMRLMIDFHYSDSWADPGKQRIPKAWEGMNISDTEKALAAHTAEVLTLLKDNGITPEWVQIGNEVPNGFLYPLAQADINPDNFARLITAGHKAAKGVFPNIITIVHIDKGDDNSRAKWLFDILQTRGAQYDMIGFSLYPDPDGWKTAADKLLSNAKYCKSRYGKSVMVCEVGMHYRRADSAYSFIKYLMNNGVNDIEGIFYWEPEAPGGYNDGYDMGCFDFGRPTHALDAFKGK